jgi:hypothetical protein
MSRDTAPFTRPARLPDGAPLDFAPNNEQGVVYLFSHLARRRFGLHVERVQSGFPDCLAYKDGKRIRIEFEHRSRNFALHRHDPRHCDWIVCWTHDWPAVPPRLRVVELRKEFGLGFNVWFQPVGGKYSEVLARTRLAESWSVPSQAMEGDLLLFYRTAPDSFVKDLFRLSGPVGHVQAYWKPGKDWMAPIRRVATLDAPLHLTQLRRDRVLRNAGFVRGSMRGRYRATEYWPDLYHLLLRTNPSVSGKLRSYGPERLW